jgi:hypothetical protein
MWVGSAVLPMAMATLRSSRMRRVRSSGEPRKRRLKAGPSSEASHASWGLMSSSRRVRSGAAEVGDFPFLSSRFLSSRFLSSRFLSSRFQGQTSWQMSQPKTWRPMGARSSRGMSPFFSMVR